VWETKGEADVVQMGMCMAAGMVLFPMALWEAKRK